MLLTFLFLALVIYSVLFCVLWGWSIIHALLTPKQDMSRRALWMAALIINPPAAMWYWYIWKRWGFWALFAPALVFVLFLPLTLDAVIKTLEVRSIADRFVEIGTLFSQNVVDAIPLYALIPIVVFPIILRLGALVHLGRNTTLNAADRNDYAIAFALPFAGLGGAIAYCLKWQRLWAAVGLAWFLTVSATIWSFVRFL